MKIFYATLLDDDVWIDGWIVKTIFKKIFLPLDWDCGFHYQVVHNRNRGKTWNYYGL